MIFGVWGPPGGFLDTPWKKEVKIGGQRKKNHSILEAFFGAVSIQNAILSQLRFSVFFQRYFLRSDEHSEAHWGRKRRQKGGPTASKSS